MNNEDIKLKYWNMFRDYMEYFLVYCILGWIYESVWCCMIYHRRGFINRGFLFGPWLPIYGVGFFIILGIHEVIVIPADVEMDRRDLEAMVQDVNAGEVLPEERLSDHVYMYDSKEKELVLADRMEERKQQREQAQKMEKAEERGGRADKADRTERKPERERVSMKDLLSEKKAEVAKNEAGRENPVAKKTRETAR